MATALEIAKQLMTYDTTDTALTTKINNTNSHAEQKLILAIGKDNYNRYKNGLTVSETGIAITAFDESLDTTDEEPLTTVTTTVHYTRDYDNVLIAGTTNYDGYYEIINRDRENNQFDIKIEYVADDATGTYSIQEFEKYKMVHAYLILWCCTYALLEFVDKRVIINSEEFGNGELRTMSIISLNKLRTDLLKSAGSFSNCNVSIF